MKNTQDTEEAIILTPTAVAMAKQLREETPSYHGQSLRLYLEGKGCDGFFYGVSFDAPNPDDISFQFDEISLVVDRDSWPFVKGSEICWVDDERGRGFLVENPNHRKFRGKFYKRAAWQQALEEKREARQPKG